MKNAYQRAEFEKKFVETDIFNQLKSEYDHLIFDKHFPLMQQEKLYITPRQQYAEPLTIPSYFSVVPFYYLEFLTNVDPDTIYDLGCGWNIFKKYIPNIIGIGAEKPTHPSFNADVHDFIDNCFIDDHKDHFKSVFSINALHFIPLSQIRQRVLDFYSMIAPGGRGWLALNAKRMIELDSESNFLSNNNVDVEAVSEYIDSELKNLPGTILLFDVDLSCLDNFMDGNIQIIFEKPRITNDSYLT